MICLSDLKVSFSSLGLDSIDCIDLVIEIEEKLSLDISNVDADRIRSVNEASIVFSKYARDSPDYLENLSIENPVESVAK